MACTATNLYLPFDASFTYILVWSINTVICTLSDISKCVTDSGIS